MALAALHSVTRVVATTCISDDMLPLMETFLFLVAFDLDALKPVDDCPCEMFNGFCFSFTPLVIEQVF